MTRQLPERWSFDDLSKEDMRALLTGALDEVYALRMLMAMNAVVTEATLDYKSFPKSRRSFSEHQAVVMRAAASGDHQAAYVEAHQHHGKQILEEVAGDSCMTNGQWILDHVHLLPERDTETLGEGQ
ncbi:hypothetical protein GCM10025867_51640 (plasmid) [Frondihabitans sucicola]|uniref:FCD domain-containing protein n=1 Tax=Frondihabitans sucicola TaxID=1268041 RepID=A0ABN6Y5R4_9MICO|nr:hypothetical protein [Frondihabitans sucicola]BDZ52356.1 hypothetical protein GCM10025867_45970 [Frondihabitans sucicola]BDZ52923.1 hypothetical protein GCM10025867_51640 [Frondihabitans sucicola]